MTPMRLLICTQAVDRTDPVLGFFHRWIEEFAKHCEKVLVICLFEGEHVLPSNVQVFSLGKERVSDSAQGEVPFIGKVVLRLYYIREFLKLIWHLRKEYDSVFVHMNPEYVVLGGPSWRYMKKGISLWYTHKATPLFLRLALPFVDQIFTASSESFRLSSRKVSITGHGIDSGRPVPEHVPAQGEIRLITSGRITPTKRLDVLIDAYLSLKKSNISATFSIIGKASSSKDKEYQEVLSAHLKSSGEDPELIFEGPIPNTQMPQRRASADYFLHASETGSLDKAVLDAVVSRVIPLSSSEAYRSLFTGCESFLLYPRGDSDVLAARIVALEALPEERRGEIREILYERVVHEHSLDTLICRFLEELPTRA